MLINYDVPVFCATAVVIVAMPLLRLSIIFQLQSRNSGGPSQPTEPEPVINADNEVLTMVWIV